MDVIDELSKMLDDMNKLKESVDNFQINLYKVADYVIKMEQEKLNKKGE